MIYGSHLDVELWSTARASLTSSVCAWRGCCGSCVQVPAAFLGVDTEGRLLELGWARVPTLMHLAWQAQYQVHMQCYIIGSMWRFAGCWNTVCSYARADGTEVWHGLLGAMLHGGLNASGLKCSRFCTNLKDLHNFARVCTTLHLQAYLADLQAAVQEEQDEAALQLPLFEHVSLEGGDASVDVDLPR